MFADLWVNVWREKWRKARWWLSGLRMTRRDAIFGTDFRDQVRDLGIREVLSAPRLPWQRAYIERVIGSIRRECLDRVIVFE